MVAGGCALLISTSCKRPADDGPDRARVPVAPSAADPELAAESESESAAESGSESEPKSESDSESASAPDADSAPDLGPVSTALSAPPKAVAAGVAIERIARGLRRPVGLEHAPGDTGGRLFVVEQHVARVRILRRKGDAYIIDPKPFLDLRGKVSRGNEQGLLSLAFHPRFAENGRLYIDYTDRRGTTRVVEYRIDAANPDQVDMKTAREIFSLEQPYGNHNGGDLAFGPDGKLYVGTGDGGAAGDPLGAGQDPENLLAKMLRIDVDAPSPRPEIIQLGLRNPWRYSFDSATGDLYIADVGQNQYEYVYVVAGDDLEGHNFGWNVVEGNHCYARKGCDPDAFTRAVIEYDHATGCSITGGLVYRGEALPALAGAYFYADFCTGILRSFRWARDGVHQHWSWDPVLTPQRRMTRISAFAADAAGELHILTLDGDIYKLVPR